MAGRKEQFKIDTFQARLHSPEGGIGSYSWSLESYCILVRQDGELNTNACWGSTGGRGLGNVLGHAEINQTWCQLLRNCPSNNLTWDVMPKGTMLVPCPPALRVAAGALLTTHSLSSARTWGPLWNAGWYVSLSSWLLVQPVRAWLWDIRSLYLGDYKEWDPWLHSELNPPFLPLHSH